MPRSYSPWFLATVLAGGAALMAWMLYRQSRGGRGNREAIEKFSKPSSGDQHFGERSARDVVEEASWESFPASDAPAW